jgi:hypothetical protein
LDWEAGGDAMLFGSGATELGGDEGWLLYDPAGGDTCGKLPEAPEGRAGEDAPEFMAPPTDTLPAMEL